MAVAELETTTRRDPRRPKENGRPPGPVKMHTLVFDGKKKIETVADLRKVWPQLFVKEIHQPLELKPSDCLCFVDIRRSALVNGMGVHVKANGFDWSIERYV